jgi:hypothetical protein
MRSMVEGAQDKQPRAARTPYFILRCERSEPRRTHDYTCWPPLMWISEPVT